MSSLVTVLLAFDQAPQHVGWAVIDKNGGDIIAGGSQRFDTIESVVTKPNDVAEIYVRNVILAARDRWELALVAYEGTYLNTKKGMWPVMDQLAELRGRCIRVARELGLSWRVVLPREWQSDLRIQPGTKSKDIKKISLRLAEPFLRRGLPKTWLTEDAADACHIARRALSRFRQETLERAWA